MRAGSGWGCLQGEEIDDYIDLPCGAFGRSVRKTVDPLFGLCVEFPEEYAKFIEAAEHSEWTNEDLDKVARSMSKQLDYLDDSLGLLLKLTEMMRYPVPTFHEVRWEVDWDEEW